MTKGVRRSQTVDGAFIDQLYTDTAALYHLDSVAANGSAKADLGPLPGTAVALLGALAAAWAGILGYASWQAARRRKKG